MPVGHLEREGEGSAAESHNRPRDHDLGPELLGLHEGPAGEGLAGDALWETEVVLDAGARPRLAPEGPRVENDHREPFRGGVYRRGQPGRPRAHDRHIVRALGIIDADHAERAREVPLGGILEHGSVRADDDRQIGVVRRVVLQQRRGLPIGGGIDYPVRPGIPGQKALQANQVRVGRRTDEDRAARARLDQADPPEQEGAHDPLADRGLGDQHGPQLVPGDDQHLGVAHGPSVDDPGRTGQHAGLGEEPAGAELDDRPDVAQTISSGDRHGPGNDDEHAGADITRRDERLRGRVGQNRPEPAEPVDLLRAEAREHLIKAGLGLCHLGIVTNLGP